MEFCGKKLDKTTSSQCVQQLVFWLLVVSSFNNFKMHAWLPSTAVVAAFLIYARRGADAAKRGGWRPCIK